MEWPMPVNPAKSGEQKPKKSGSAVASITNEYGSVIMIFYFRFRPAAFKIAWHVPVGISFAPWNLHESDVDGQPLRNTGLSPSALSSGSPPVLATESVR